MADKINVVYLFLFQTTIKMMMTHGKMSLRELQQGLHLAK